MRYGKVWISLLTAALMAAAGIMGLVEARNRRQIPISVTVDSPGGAETLTCWQAGKEEYYVFLPSYASLSQAYVQVRDRGSITLDGIALTQGGSLEAFQEDREYVLLHDNWLGSRDYTLTFLRSAGIPALYLDTQSGSMAYIHEAKEHQERGSLRLYTSEGELTHSGSFSKLEGHGNSTWEAEKKPYNLEFDQDTDLLGMGGAKKWVLLANSVDMTHLRNKLVYEFAREIGLSYSPESRWVELYLNGEYAGLYLLCERNEVHPQRVAIDPDDSFLVSKEWAWRLGEKPSVTTAAGTALRIRYASMEEDAVLQVVQSVENAILSPDGTDPVTGKGWQELIDLDSWVKKYLLEEVFGNADGDILSQYFYYEAGDGKLYAGPVWDYDRTMGNPIFNQQEGNQLFADRPGVPESGWYYALCRKPEFQEALVRTFEETFLPALQALLEYKIGDYADRTAQAAASDRVRWNTWDPGEQTAALQDYMTRRLTFLQSLWIEKESYCLVVVNGYSNAKNCYALRPGQLPPALPDYSYRTDLDIDGWYYEGTDVPFDPEAPVTEDVEITLRYEKRKSAAQEDPEPPSPLRYGPVVIFVGMLGLLALVSVLQTKRSGAKDHERTQKQKISP